MALDLSALPDEVRALIAAQAAMIARLQAQLAKLRRMHFGRSSERLDAAVAQLELALEDLEEQQAVTQPDAVAPAEPAVDADVLKPARRPLPQHLPREVVTHPAACACPRCGGELRRLGEDVTEVLDYQPALFRVIRHVRAKFSCRACETITQAPAPSLPIRRGRASAALLAHVLTAKFCDHLPLYRQSDIHARAGVALERSTLADWVGQVFVLLRPLIDVLERHVMAGDRLYADDTTVPVLAPGTGKTKTGRLWAYLRDERPYGGTAPPAVRIATALIAAPSIHAHIWYPSAACCRPMAPAALMGCMLMDASLRQHAGRMCGATSTTSTSPPGSRRSPSRRWSALPSSTLLRHASSASRPISAGARYPQAHATGRGTATARRDACMVHRQPPQDVRS